MTYYQLLICGAHLLAPLRTTILHKVAEMKEAHTMAERAAAEIVEDLGGDAIGEDGKATVLLSRTVRYIRDPTWVHFVELHHPNESTHDMVFPDHVPKNNVFWSVYLANKEEGNPSTQYKGDETDKSMGEGRNLDKKKVENPFADLADEAETAVQTRPAKRPSTTAKKVVVEQVAVSESPFAAPVRKHKEGKKEPSADMSTLDEAGKQALREQKASDPAAPAPVQIRKREHREIAAEPQSVNPKAASSRPRAMPKAEVKAEPKPASATKARRKERA